MNKGNRETKRLIDSLGGGIETNVPRSSRITRKLNQNQTQNKLISSSFHSSPSSSSFSSSSSSIQIQIQNNPNHQHQNLIIKKKLSDSSLSELSDSIEKNKPNNTNNTFQKEKKNKNLMKKLTKQKGKKLNEKNIFLGNNNTNRSRRVMRFKNQHGLHFKKLNAMQKKEMEEKKIMLLKNLEQEEELIRVNQHPVLVSIERNIHKARLIKINQAHSKLTKLIHYFNLLNFEKIQRIFCTWIDKKIRLRSDLIADGQIRLNRAPFEFLISSDTTNLQAIFHLTPAPPAPHQRPHLSVNQVEKAGEGVSEPKKADDVKRMNSWNQKRKMVGESSTKKKEDKKIKLRHPHAPLVNTIFNSVDLIDGLIHQKISRHNVWKLSSHDVNHDLNLLKKSSARF